MKRTRLCIIMAAFFVCIVLSVTNATVGLAANWNPPIPPRGYVPPETPTFPTNIPRGYVPPAIPYPTAVAPSYPAAVPASNAQQSNPTADSAANANANSAATVSPSPSTALNQSSSAVSKTASTNASSASTQTSTTTAAVSTAQSAAGIPGFEVLFAVVGFAIVAYVVSKKR